MRDSPLVFFPFLLFVCFFFGKFNNLDKFIFYLGWSILNYAEIAFRIDNEIAMSKELFELRATSSRSRKFQYGWKLFKNTWETTDCLKFWIKLLQIENLMCIITNICKMLIMSKRAISCNHHRWCHTVLYHALPSLGEYTAILLILKVLM